MKSQCELDEGQPGQPLGLAQALYPVDDRGRACRRRRRNQSSKCSAQTLLRPQVLLPERLALVTSMLLRPTIGLGPVRSWRLVFSGSKHHWRRNRPSLESQQRYSAVGLGVPNLIWAAMITAAQAASTAEYSDSSTPSSAFYSHLMLNPGHDAE